MAAISLAGIFSHIDIEWGSPHMDLTQLARKNGKNRSLDSSSGNGKPTSSTVRLPIRWKITFPYIILAIIIAFGAVQVITRVVFDTVDARFASQLIEAGKLASSGMVGEETRLLEALRLMVNSQGVPAAVGERNAEQLRELLFPIVVNNSIEMVEVLDEAGRLVISMRRMEGGQLIDYQFSKAGDDTLSKAIFVKQVLAATIDQKGDKFSGSISVSNQPIFYVAGPIFDETGRQVGVLMTGSRLRSLALRLREQTLTQITFYDLDGGAIASTFSDPRKLDATMVGSILETQDWQSPRRDLLGQRDVSYSEIDYTEILGPWEVRSKVEDLGVMGISLVKDFFVKTTQATRLQISLLSGLVLVLILLIGLNLASLITRPLIDLVKASVEVSKGNLEVQVKGHTRDEIEVLSTTFNLMVSNLHQSKIDLEKAYDSTLEGWAKALEFRDNETRGHSDRVTALTLSMAEEMNIDPERFPHIRRGALLHDIGKMGIPDNILLKAGPLTAEEREVMQRHVQYAYDLLYPIEYLRPAIHIPYGHHEKWDGTGYPNRIRGEDIPLEARIFALIDVWDAITSDRVYRKAMTYPEAINIIQKDRGTHFDPQLADIFIKHVNLEMLKQKV